MQSLCLLGRSSSDCRGGGGGGGGGGLFPLPSRKLASFVGMWAHTCDRRRKPSDRATPVAGAAAGGEQDHYAVLGISRTAASGEIKKAYRLLARKYHPDVSRDLQAGEVFKSIRLAYEVLSNEVARARYDMSLKFPEARSDLWSTRRWAYSPEFDETLYRWEKLRKHMQYKRRKKEEEASSSNYRRDSQQETSGYKRVSFSKVLHFAFFTFFFMEMVGHQASLALCGAAALLDQQLDVEYKMGYVIAWLFGGQGGILLALCIYFASWLCEKKSTSLAALLVLAMWVGANIASFVPLPRGAVLTLLYMSMKLQVDSK